MLPKNLSYINAEDIKPAERISKTFRLDHEKGRVISQPIDGQEAIAQAIWINLGIEKGVWEIHTPEYGIEFAKLYGRDKDLAKAQLETIIKRALGWDERIYSTSNYVIEDIDSTNDSISVDFDVNSSAGTFRTGVTINV